MGGYVTTRKEDSKMADEVGLFIKIAEETHPSSVGGRNRLK